MKKTEKISLLLIGPLPPPVGGTTVSFKELVDSLLSMHVQSVYVVDTARQKQKRLLGRLFFLSKMISRIFWLVPQVDVVGLHASQSSTLFMGVLLRAYSKLFGKPLIYRGFGGNLDIYYESLPLMLKYAFKKSVLSSDRVLLQTKHLVVKFNAICENVVWYPNSRKNLNEHYFHVTEKDILSLGLRCVFLGHIKPSKGVYEIIDSVKQIEKEIDQKIIIDFYGPLLEGVTIDDFCHPNIAYKGALQPSEVAQTISSYDVLLLPSYYSGEGYPGVILEAYSVGVPVIATKWRFIPEIVDQTCGILVEPKSSNDIRDAIICLVEDPGLLKNLKLGAKKKAEEFDSIEMTKMYLEIVKSVSSKQLI